MPITKQEKRLARKLSGPSQMDRVRAARAYINAHHFQCAENMEMAAFLAVLHPEIPEEKRRKMVRELGK